MKIKLNKRKNIKIIYDNNINEITYRFIMYSKYISNINMTAIKEINTYSFRNFIHHNRLVGKSINLNSAYYQCAKSDNDFGLTIIGLSYY